MFNLFAASSDSIVAGIIFGVVGVIFAAGIVVTIIRVVRIARSPARKPDGTTSWDRKAAELARTMSADELYGLAMSHMDGTVANADSLLARPLMLKAAEKGSAQAQFYMGKQCDYADNAQAIEWFKRAAAQGLDEACEKLGDVYHYGRDTGRPVIEENPGLALEYYLPLAEKGNVEVQKTVALIYALDFDDENEFKWNLKAAQAGDIEAIEDVVEYYDMKDDLDNAVLWCKKFVDGKGKDALYRMGRLYEFAEPADMEKAVYWYKRAADEGDKDAEVKLGTLYLEGVGLPKNEGKAIEIFKTCAAEGNKLGILNLGRCYYKGTGVGRDCKKAFKLLSSVESTFSSAQYYLALMYLKGDGVEKNAQTAYRLLVAASEYGDGDVLYKLGECCFFGTGCESDKPRARGLWREAAEDGSEEAIAALDRYFGEMFVPKEGR